MTQESKNSKINSSKIVDSKVDKKKIKKKDNVNELMTRVSLLYLVIYCLFVLVYIYLNKLLFFRSLYDSCHRP